MILVAPRDTLAAALSRVAGIVDSRQTIPILGNVHLSAADDMLTIRATNLDMEAVEIIPAAVGESGETTVSASKLRELTNSLPAGSQVAMKLGERLAVTSGRSKFNLGILPPKDFPQLWIDALPTSFEIPANELASLINRVAYAQSTDAAKAYLQGVNFHTVSGKLRIAATNTHIITYVDGPEIPDLNSFTVPTKMVSEISRLLSGPELATVGFSEAKIMVSLGTTTITSKLIDRSLKFPQYERAIPQNCPHTAIIDADATIGAIRRALIASQGMKDNTVKLTFKSGALAVTAQNAEADAFDEIDAEYDGEDVTVSLNPTYVIDILSAFDTDRIEVQFGDNKSNLIWKIPEDAGLVVTAPQRVG